MLVKRAQIIKRQGLGQVLKTMGVLLKDCIAGSFPGGLGSNPRRKLCLKDQWSAHIQQNSSNTKQKTGGFKTLQFILFQWLVVFLSIRNNNLPDTNSVKLFLPQDFVTTGLIETQQKTSFIFN